MEDGWMVMKQFPIGFQFPRARAASAWNYKIFHFRKWNIPSHTPKNREYYSTFFIFLGQNYYF
jgi:hypothetical protein